MADLHIAIVAGEASGDRLGAPLIEALRRRYPNARFTGIGGRQMQTAGLESQADMSRLSVMGLVEVITHLADIVALKKSLLKFWAEHPPDLFIGIDAPDFNLRLANALNARGVQTVQYVSPSLWAWKEKRIEKIKKSIDLVLCLFPFETAVYQKHHVAAVCVGHPMTDRLNPITQQEARRTLALPYPERPMIGLFPGSRKGEIERLLPVFMHAFTRIKARRNDLSALVSAADADHKALIATMLNRMSLHDDVIISDRDSALLIAASDVVLLASGTITLEAALLERAMLVAYRVHPLTAMIARRLLKIDRYSLPNLLAGKTVVHEWIQEKCTPENLCDDATRLLCDSAARKCQLDALREIAAALPNNVSARAAQAIVMLRAGKSA